MPTFVRRLIGLFLGAAVVIFAVSNRSEVQVDFWPFVEGLALPLYLAVLLPLLIGFGLGYAIARLRSPPKVPAP